MKPRIFSTRILLLCSILLAYNSFAQTNGTNKDFDQEMEKLESQMGKLQGQMSKMQAEEIKKHAKELQKMAKELSAKTLASIDTKQLKTWAKQFTISQDAFKWVTPPIDPIAPAAPGAVGTPPTPPMPPMNYNDSDENLRKLIQEGEVKEKTKSYSKSYSADANDKLQISNVYGKVTVNTWNRNEVKVDVEMKAFANNENEAQKMLDNINITDSKDNSVISFRTVIGRSGGGQGNGWVMLFGPGKSNVRKSEINYTVYMPAKNQLQISNRYGSTILPNFPGKVIIDQAYGSLQAKALLNPANEIRIKYGSADIQNLVSSDLNVSYGSVNVGEAEKLNADVSYGSASIGKLKAAGVINARYCGGLQINDVDKSVKNLQVNSSYSNVKLGMADNIDVDFDVTVSYGKFNYGSSKVKLVNQPEDDGRHFNPTKTYKGQLGKGNSDKVITVTSKYGNVKFD